MNPWLERYRALKAAHAPGDMDSPTPEAVPSGHISEVFDDAEIIAVNVWSDVLQAAVWVVVDDLSREDWPTDAPVYRQAEVKILKQMGPDMLAWVHATKEMFGAEVVKGGRRPVHRSHIAPAENASNGGPGDRNVSEKRL